MAKSNNPGFESNKLFELKTDNYQRLVNLGDPIFSVFATKEMSVQESMCSLREDKEKTKLN
jgi:hypothetical protein